MAASAGIPDTDTVRGLFNKGVAENWRFTAVLPDIDQANGSNYSFSGNNGASYSSSPKLSRPNTPFSVLESVDAPPITIDADQRFGGGTKIYVPRFKNTATFTLNFYEDQDYSVSKYLWAWRGLMINEYNLYNVPTMYKKDISIWAFDSVSNYAAVMMIDFIECWPTSLIGGLSYSHSAAGFLTVNAEFTIDGQEMQFTGGNGSGNNTVVTKG